MPRYEHSGAATSALATIPITNSGLTLQCDSLSGWPTGAIGQFWVTLDRGLATEEKILCASRSGNTLTIAAGGRGADGTSAQAHAVGATVEHTYSATEADEASAHIQANTGVHGVSGSVVGTTSTQTLTNKTLTAPAITSPAISGAGTVAGTLTGGTLNPTTLQQGGVAVPTISSADTLSNKTLTSPTINGATLSGTMAGGTLNPTALTKGGVNVPTISETATLTNKTLSAPAITDAVVSSSVAGNIAASIRGASGQTARIFEVLSNGGTTYFSITSAGSVQCPVNLNVNGSFASNASTALVNTTATPSSASGAALIAKGLASQTGNLQEWQNSAGTALSYVDKDGRLVNKIPSVYTPVTTNQGPTSGATELTIASAPAITGDGASKVKISVAWNSVTFSNAGDTFEIHVKDGATQLMNYRLKAQGTTAEAGGSTFVIDTPSAGSHTYTATIVRVTGTGTATLAAGSTQPITILVEQILG